MVFSFASVLCELVVCEASHLHSLSLSLSLSLSHTHTHTQAHSHWSQVTDNKILINWGSYGEYEMVLDSSGDTMAGNLKGQPDNWYLFSPSLLSVSFLLSLPTTFRVLRRRKSATSTNTNKQTHTTGERRKGWGRWKIKL